MSNDLKEAPKNISVVEIKIGNQVIKAEIADTPEKRQQGLSNRKNLPDNTGLLFVFDKADKYSFWMKEMNFPIDIIWLANNKKIVGLTTGLTPDTYPKKFSSKKPAQFVLEVPAGFAQEKNLKIGDQVSW